MVNTLTRPLNYIKFTYTSITAENSTALFSGSYDALTQYGFIVNKTGDNTVEKQQSKSFSIIVPLASGSQAGLSITKMNIWSNYVSGSVENPIMQEAIDAGYTIKQRATISDPIVDPDYNNDPTLPVIIGI